VVIDAVNHRPLKAFPNLPITVSKKVEGWLMEAWERQNRNIDVEDLIQRMPFAANDDVWTNRRFSNALTQRKDRFRNRGRCLSWKVVAHDREWDRKLKEDMNANKAWLNANTTRYLSDLTVKEDKALEAVTFMSRKHTKRAGHRQLHGPAKIDKERKMSEIANAYKKKDDAAPSDDEDLQELTTLGDDWQKVGQSGVLPSSGDSNNQDEGYRAVVPDDQYVHKLVETPLSLLLQPHEGLISPPEAGLRRRLQQIDTAPQVNFEAPEENEASAGDFFERHVHANDFDGFFQPGAEATHFSEVQPSMTMGTSKDKDVFEGYSANDLSDSRLQSKALYEPPHLSGAVGRTPGYQFLDDSCVVSSQSGVHQSSDAIQTGPEMPRHNGYQVQLEADGTDPFLEDNRSISTFTSSLLQAGEQKTETTLGSAKFEDVTALQPSAADDGPATKLDLFDAPFCTYAGGHLYQETFQSGHVSQELYHDQSFGSTPAAEDTPELSPNDESGAASAHDEQKSPKTDSDSPYVLVLDPELQKQLDDLFKDDFLLG
jgi:hypothetical protein